MSAPPSTRRTQRDEPHFLRAGDDVPITLIHVRGRMDPSKPPVVLVHGAGMRAESFRPPIPRTVVDALIDDGWDVWMLNWRGSIDLDPRPWTLDDVARHDLPRAVSHIRDQTGAATVKLMAHCAGAISASMAAVAGLVPDVDVLIANGASLHPALRGWSRIKLRTLLPALHARAPYLDVAWRDGPEGAAQTVIRSAVRGWHTECASPVCNMASFALGAGRPALWMHRNLDVPTHEWLASEFGRIPMSFYTQLAASARAGRMVSSRPGRDLPRAYADAAPRSTARFALFTGEGNRAFLPESQRRTHAYLDRHHPGRHALHVVPGYRHTDMFIGRRAHIDVFPRMIAELNAPSMA